MLEVLKNADWEMDPHIQVDSNGVGGSVLMGQDPRSTCIVSINESFSQLEARLLEFENRYYDDRSRLSAYTKAILYYSGHGLIFTDDKDTFL